MHTYAEIIIKYSFIVGLLLRQRPFNFQFLLRAQYISELVEAKRDIANLLRDILDRELSTLIEETLGNIHYVADAH